MTGRWTRAFGSAAPSLAIGALVGAIVLTLPALVAHGAHGEGAFVAQCKPVECPAPGSRMHYGFAGEMWWDPPADPASAAWTWLAVGTTVGLVAGVRRGWAGLVGALAFGCALALLMGHVLQPGSMLNVAADERPIDGSIDGTVRIVLAQTSLMGPTWRDALDEAIIEAFAFGLAHALLVARRPKAWPWQRWRG